MVGRNRALHQQDYKEDVVYLFQPPRATYIPNASPFSLKLETWLRMNEIPYEATSVDLLNTSKKGQLPFVELNGKEIADSKFIILELAEHFKKELKLDDMQKAIAEAFESLIEDSLFWVLLANRSHHCDALLNDPSLIRFLPAPLRPIRSLGAKVMSNRLKSKAFHQGIGRHSPAEVNAVGGKMLQSISTFLADKDYMLGEKASWIDATAFGHLSQFWYTPIELELKKTIESTYPNLVAYLERMKAAYWPDWTEICAPPASAKAAKEKMNKSVDNEKASAKGDEAAKEQVADELKAEPADATVGQPQAVESQ